MLAAKENRFQHIYFVLSGGVASMIILLIYMSLRETNREDMRVELRSIQKQLHFNKPSISWHYSNTWRPIGNNSSRRHLVYSAYFDSRIDIVADMATKHIQVPLGSFRIFAILPFNFKDTVNCILRFDDYTFKEIAAKEVRRMHEHQGKTFAAYSIMCPFVIPRFTKKVTLPQAVALAYRSVPLSRISPTFVAISYPRNMQQIYELSRPIIAICVAPLPTNYSDVMRLVEFVEIYRIQGVRHFYFYYNHVSDEVLRVLQHYRNKNIADVLDWNLQNFNEEELYANGLVAQYNECIYRAAVVENYRYAAILDLDEIIMPLKQNSLADYLHQCDEGRTSAFIFRNVFFYKKDHNDTFSVPAHTRNRFLYTQLKMRRTVEIMPSYLRSKCVVNAHSIIEMADHGAWRVLPGYGDITVHHNVGLLFHYRDKCYNCKNLLMTDFTARKFGSLIWDKVDDACLEMFIENGGICPMG